MRFERLDLDRADCRAQAERFDSSEFDRRFKAAVDIQVSRAAQAGSVSREARIRLA